MIKVVVIDDSAFMRKAISSMLERDPEIEVVATARDGQEGVEKVLALQPDVVTLDVEMPKMDGLATLRRIMMERPTPVIMISSLTIEGAEATLKALDMGAVDFIPKQFSKVSLDIIKIEDSLREKIKSVAKRKIRLRPLAARTRPAPGPQPAVPGAGTGTAAGAGGGERHEIQQPAGQQLRDVVAVGVSTGGPPAVQKVLSALPANFPASILIAQHMPQAFTGPFARRLDSVCAITVKEAEHGERMRPGVAYVAPGGQHLLISHKVSQISVVVSPEPREALYKPSANVLIASVGEAVGRRALGVILTGMGSDGLEGVRALKAKGGRILAQDEASCVVYGMPKSVVEAGLADEVVDIDAMAQAVVSGLYK